METSPESSRVIHVPREQEPLMRAQIVREIGDVLKRYEPFYLPHPAHGAKNPFTKERYQAYEHWLGRCLEEGALPGLDRQELILHTKQVVTLYTYLKMLTAEHCLPVRAYLRYEWRIKERRVYVQYGSLPDRTTMQRELNGAQAATFIPVPDFFDGRPLFSELISEPVDREQAMVTYHFSESMRWDEVNDFMREHGYRPALVEDLYAFAKDLGLTNTVADIVALGNYVYINDCWRVPILQLRGDLKILNVTNKLDRFPTDTRFLFVREDPSVVPANELI